MSPGTVSLFYLYLHGCGEKYHNNYNVWRQGDTVFAWLLEVIGSAEESGLPPQDLQNYMPLSTNSRYIYFDRYLQLLRCINAPFIAHPHTCNHLQTHSCSPTMLNYQYLHHKDYCKSASMSVCLLASLHILYIYLHM